MRVLLGRVKSYADRGRAGGPPPRPVPTAVSGRRGRRHSAAGLTALGTAGDDACTWAHRARNMTDFRFATTTG